jgi:hypothetical protein
MLREYTPGKRVFTLFAPLFAAIVPLSFLVMRLSIRDQLKISL